MPPEAQSIDQSFQDTLVSNATQIAGASAAAIVTPDFTNILLQLATGLFESCLGTPAPAPAPGGDPTTQAAPFPPALQAATNLKNASPVQHAMLHTRARRIYVQNGMTRQHGNVAAGALIQATTATSVEDLATVIDHVNNSFPQVDMF